MSVTINDNTPNGTGSVPDAYIIERKVIIDGEEQLQVIRGMWSCGELQEIIDTFPIGPSKHAIALRQKRKAWLAEQEGR